MRVTSRKKEILSYYEPGNLEWVKGDIGAPPLDVSGVTYLLHVMELFNQCHQLESTQRTLESMVADGLLERGLIQSQYLTCYSRPDTLSMKIRAGFRDQRSIHRESV